MTRSPWRFQGYEQQQLTGFTLLPRSSHPTDATPTMESCSRSSRRDKLVLWSQEYFRLMESWRFLKNDSRSRASLKNCRDKREGYLVLSASWHQDGERTTPLCRLIRQSWITKATPGKQQGCLPQSPLNTRVSLLHPSETTALSPCVPASDSTWLSGLFHEKPRGWGITCFNLLIWLQNDQEAYLIRSKSKQR